MSSALIFLKNMFWKLSMRKTFLKSIDYFFANQCYGQLFKVIIQMLQIVIRYNLLEILTIDHLFPIWQIVLPEDFFCKQLSWIFLMWIAIIYESCCFRHLVCTLPAVKDHFLQTDIDGHMSDYLKPESARLIPRPPGIE